MARLNALTTDIWTADSDLYSGPMHFSLRMTVVRRSSGELVLISPIELDDELQAELERIGPVGFILAPCTFHHLYVPGALERFPKARLLGVPGLETKRKDIEWPELVSTDGCPALEADFDLELFVASPKLAEVALLHRKTGTLILTDLIFNIVDEPSMFTRGVLKMVRAYGRPAQSRLWRFMTRDRGAVQRSARRVMDWDIQRVVMAHGQPLDHNPKPALEAALDWMLNAA